MSTNDFLATLAGISPSSNTIQRDSAESEQISYDDIDEYEHNPEKDDYEEEVQPERGSQPKKRVNRRWGSEIQALQFTNPGDKTSKMLPDTSDIINRNRGRRAVVDQKDEDPHHDRTGKLTFTVKGQKYIYDLCDCLNPGCNGCRWPCKNCKSRKCAVGCRQNRKDLIVKVEEMHTVAGNSEHYEISNPYFSRKIT